jgi:hypothetical protein
MKKNVYIIISLAILILVSIFFVWEKNKKQGMLQIDKSIQKISTTAPVSVKATTTLENTRSTSTSVALGWATYINNGVGFSIEYPKNFVYTESDPKILPAFVAQFGDKVLINNQSSIISVSVAPTSIYKSFDDYFKDVQKADPYIIDKKSEIDGSEAIFYHHVYNNSTLSFNTEVVVKHGNAFYSIDTNSFNQNYRKADINYYPDLINNLLSEDDYNKVISSFKFLK